MEQTVTIKIKLKLKNPSDADKLVHTMEMFRQASNYISQYIFDHDFLLNQNKIQKAIYHEIRDKFNLKSQFAISAIRGTVARYKTVQTQLEQKPFRYNTGEKDQFGDEIWKKIPRDLSWLWKPVFFKRPQADLQRNRDWSILKDGTLSLNTLDGRIKATSICHGFDQYLDGTWKLGLAKILHVGNKWMLHISATKEFLNYQKEQSQHVVGVDRGLRFLATVYDEKGKTVFFDGQKIVRKRRKFKQLRTQLQLKGTKSAKRRLKKIGQRENRWMTDINHRLSKTLVDRYGANTLFVLENLVNVRFATEKVAKDRRYEQVSWAFYQLEQFLTYKAHLVGSEVVDVSARYTSQRCPKCGRINKDNRNHHLHLYQCDRCGYKSNDDRIGAINIQLLGTQYVSGVPRPAFKKSKKQPTSKLAG